MSEGQPWLIELTVVVRVDFRIASKLWWLGFHVRR